MAKSKHQEAPKPAAEKAKGGASEENQATRVIAVLLVALALGVAGGAFVVAKLPVRSLLPGARAAGALVTGDAAALVVAATAERDTPEKAARGALADALLLVDFAGGAEHVERLRLLAKAEPAVRTAPEGLYARALFARTGVADPTLDGDLEEVSGKSGAPAAAIKDDKGDQDDQGDQGDQDDKGDQDGKAEGSGGQAEEGVTQHPALRLARAARLLDAGKPVDAWQETESAALQPDAPVYALVAAARLALARGEPRDAAAFAERGLARAPHHGMLLALRVLASAFEMPPEDAPSVVDAEQDKPKQKGKKPTGKGDQKPDEAAAPPPTPKGPAPASPAELGIVKLLDELSGRDLAVVAWTLEALALARGDATQATTHSKRVLAEVTGSATLAARQAELSMLAGDVAAADELVKAALTRSPGQRDLLLARARVRALKLVPADAPRATASVGADRKRGLAMPRGRLVLDAAAADLPLRAELDPSVAPDRQLLAERAAGDANLEARLGVVENVWQAERALERGDVPAALEAAAAARSQAPNNTEALLVDASARLRKGDRDGMRAALTAALAEAGDDPRVLLAAARTSFEAADLPATRAHLSELARLGYQSPAALALTAMLCAGEGDAKAAAVALKDAEAISPDDVDVMRARTALKAPKAP